MIRYFLAVLSISAMLPCGAQDSLAVTTVDTTIVVDTPVVPKVSTPLKRPQVYKLKAGIDVPLTLATAGFSGYMLSQIYSKDPSSQETILALDKYDIPKFDRWAADVYNEKADEVSDIPFNVAMGLPIVLLFDKKIRRDGWKIGFLYVQAMSITGVLYTSATTVNRYRPLAYNSEAPMDDRLSGNAKNSFFAGHVALVATSTFFTAKVFADYNPHSKWKWVFYTAAAGSTAMTAYLRHMGGKHFPSDILIGTAVGTLSGILVPHFHKNKDLKKAQFSLVPYFGNEGGSGIAMMYRF